MKFKSYLNEMVIIPNNITTVKINRHKKRYLAAKDYTEVVKLLNNLFRAYKTKFLVNKITSNAALDDENIEASTGFPNLNIRFIANSSFYEFLRHPKYFDTAVSTIHSMLGHENIHIQQILRSNKINTWDYPETEDVKEYFSRPSEIMAYAHHFSTEIQAEGLDKNTALKAIRSNKSALIEFFNKSSYALYAILFKSTDPVWKRFNKYLWQYINAW